MANRANMISAAAVNYANDFEDSWDHVPSFRIMINFINEGLTSIEKVLDNNPKNRKTLTKFFAEDVAEAKAARKKLQDRVDYLLSVLSNTVVDLPDAAPAGSI